MARWAPRAACHTNMPTQADSPHTDPDVPLIAICIPTYRRNDLLHACLRSIAALERPAQHNLWVIVVDNEAAGGAKAVVDELRGAFPFPLHYSVEPRRGLSSVRNRLLETALGMRAEWIAFIDDDERAEPQWLVNHLAALCTARARVATGPVIETDANNAVLAWGKSRKSGSEPRYVSCNNVLLSQSLVAEQGLRFDRQFDFIGGEDFDFFDQSRRLGNCHVWVAEARVLETIPPERLTWGYLFTRHFSGAVNSVARYRKLHGAPRAWFHFSFKAAGKLAGALISLLAAVLAARRRNAREAVKKSANGIGYLVGLLNIKVERYR